MTPSSDISAVLRPREDHCWAHQRSRWSRPYPKPSVSCRSFKVNVNLPCPTAVFSKSNEFQALLVDGKYFWPAGHRATWVYCRGFCGWQGELPESSGNMLLHASAPAQRSPLMIVWCLALPVSCVFHLFPPMKRGCVTLKVALSLDSCPLNRDVRWTLSARVTGAGKQAGRMPSLLKRVDACCCR